MFLVSLNVCPIIINICLYPNISFKTIFAWSLYHSRWNKDNQMTTKNKNIILPPPTPSKKSHLLGTSRLDATATRATLKRGGCHKRNHHIFAHQFCKIPPSHWCACAVSNSKMQYAAAIPWHARLNNYSLHQQKPATPKSESSKRHVVGYYYRKWCSEGFVVWCTLFLQHELLIFFLLEKQEEIWGERLRGRSLKRNIYFVYI